MLTPSTEVKRGRAGFAIDRVRIERFRFLRPASGSIGNPNFREFRMFVLGGYSLDIFYGFTVQHINLSLYGLNAANHLPFFASPILFEVFEVLRAKENEGRFGRDVDTMPIVRYQFLGVDLLICHSANLLSFLVRLISSQQQWDLFAA